MKILIYYMPIYFLLLFVVSFYFFVCEKNKKKILEQYQAEAQHCSSLSLPAPHRPTGLSAHSGAHARNASAPVA